MKFFANRNTLVVLLSLAIASAISVPCQAQFGGGGAGGSPFETEKPTLDAKNAALHVYSLKHIPAQEAAKHLDFLLGKGLARISFDKNRNLLLVVATTEIDNRIDDILRTLDALAKEKTSSSKMHIPPKTLLVHTFWLADGLKEGEGSLTTGLPNSVYHALQKLGLETPRTVARSTSSLIAKVKSDDDKNSKQFRSKMSAIIHGRTLQLENNGNLGLLEHQQIKIQMRTIISGTTFVPGGRNPKRLGECEVEGSLTVPLGHYMVLGTANYAGRPDLAGQQLPMPLDSKQQSMLPIQPFDQGKLPSSRFAFVIQVVEANSFAPDKSASEPREPGVDPFGSSGRAKNFDPK